MSDLCVIVPSRGRPRNVVALFQSWGDTCANADLVIGVDDDDPTLGELHRAIEPWLGTQSPFTVIQGPRQGLGGTLNTLATRYAQQYRYVGFMGDDHRPRTTGWDRRIVEALDEVGTGICYGDDLFQRENLPTAVFMSSDIVNALGWFAPPAQRHLYFDDAWKALGEAAGCLRYLPDVVIEHMHPAAHKADMDDGYAEVNSDAMYDHDRAAFEAWKADGFAADVDKIRLLRSERAA